MSTNTVINVCITVILVNQNELLHHFIRNGNMLKTCTC